MYVEFVAWDDMNVCRFLSLTLDLALAHDDLVKGAAQPGELRHPGLGVSSQGRGQTQAEQAEHGPHDERG